MNIKAGDTIVKNTGKMKVCGLFLIKTWHGMINKLIDCLTNPCQNILHDLK